MKTDLLSLPAMLDSEVTTMEPFFKNYIHLRRLLSTLIPELVNSHVEKKVN
jgi:hypothetical protein